jgi:hypothetical protein
VEAPEDHPEELIDFWHRVLQKELEHGTDRSFVIVVATLLDQAVEALLRSHLVHVPTAEDPLFEGAYAPLQSFSAKIDLGYRLGLTSPRTCKAMHLVRRIRNDFAHEIAGCAFDSASVRSRTTALVKALPIAERSKARSFFPAGPKGDFAVTVSYLLWSLWKRVAKTSALEPRAEPSIVAEAALPAPTNVAPAQ